MATKGDIVRAALRKAAIASNATLTNVEPESMADGLFDLELMMAELDGNGVRVGFKLADDPDVVSPDDDSGLPDWAVAPVIMNLCVMVLPDYVREANSVVVSRANFGLQTLMKATANQTTPKYRYPNGWPMGSGNILYRRVGIRYFHFAPQVTIENDGTLQQ